MRRIPLLLLAMSLGLACHAQQMVVPVDGSSSTTNAPTKATIKAASTAAGASDTALVVAISPNNAVSVTQSATGATNPCASPGATLVSLTGATSGTTASQIIALSGTTKVYICSLTVIGVSGTTPTFSLVQGTGSNCASSQTVLVQAWGTTAGALYAFANPVAVSVAGNAVCFLDGGTTPVQNYQITYAQQ